MKYKVFKHTIDKNIIFVHPTLYDKIYNSTAPLSFPTNIIPFNYDSMIIKQSEFLMEHWIMIPDFDYFEEQDRIVLESIKSVCDGSFRLTEC
jgi:hypothetical protein